LARLVKLYESKIKFEKNFPLMTLTLLLDRAYDLLATGDVNRGMAEICESTHEVYQNLSPEEWSNLWQSVVFPHPVTTLIHQDPFTYHSFNKPRGYAGDAELLDYIYGLRTDPDISAIGQKVFDFSINTAAPASVRSRCQILAKTIDNAAQATAAPHILSIACGHLREAKLSEAVRDCAIGKFIAFDQDPLSLELIKSELGDYGIETECGNVGGIIRGNHAYSNLDLVYAAGLYDYLSQPMAVRLTKVMFEMLRSGGTLLVANFVPHKSIGYMESFMQWQLIYRSVAEVEAFSAEIESSQIAQSRTFLDEHENIVFLELVRA
jgi:extracellular factor (EF) 3-hydroxypalmitic acid methyl ester biosynthesis protein